MRIKSGGRRRRSAPGQGRLLTCPFSPWHDRRRDIFQDITMLKLRLATFLAAFLMAGAAQAARCGGDFNSFLSSFAADAQNAGVSQGVIASALGGVTEDASVLA